MKTGALINAVCVMLIFSAVAIAAGEQPSRGADQMMLQGGKIGAVPFPHRRHQQVLGDCNVCHDLFDRETGSIETLKAQGKLRKKQIMNDQCKACHQKKEAAGEKTGPTGCRDCHVK